MNTNSAFAFANIVNSLGIIEAQTLSQSHNQIIEAYHSVRILLARDLPKFHIDTHDSEDSIKSIALLHMSREAASWARALEMRLKGIIRNEVEKLKEGDEPKALDMTYAYHCTIYEDWHELSTQAWRARVSEYINS